jgi:hypothetical protein
MSSDYEKRRGEMYDGALPVSSGMTPDAYRAAIAALNLSQRAAARVIGVNERTSRTYAAHGVPERHSAWVRDKLADYHNTTWAAQFAKMAAASEREETND